MIYRLIKKGSLNAKRKKSHTEEQVFICQIKVVCDFFRVAFELLCASKDKRLLAGRVNSVEYKIFRVRRQRDGAHAIANQEHK